MLFKQIKKIFYLKTVVVDVVLAASAVELVVMYVGVLTEILNVALLVGLVAVFVEDFVHLNI